MAEPAAGGVLHDIGFRHYAGPRLGRRDVVRALFVESLRGAYGLGRSTRSKVMPFLLLAVVVLPAVVVAVVVNVTPTGELPVGYVDYQIAVTALLALFVAVAAPGSVSRDLRYRVVTLYFSRPLARADYVRAKLAALSAALFLLLALPVLVLYAGALLAKLPFGEQTEGLVAALVGDVLLAVLLAGIGLVIAAVTPRRGLGVAAVIGVLVVLVAVQGTMQALGNQQGSDLAGWSGLLTPFTLVHGVLRWAFGADVVDSLDVPAPPGDAGGPVFLLVGLAVAAGLYALLVLRYRRVPVS